MPYKQRIDQLILNYFIQEGYKEAAITFAREINVDLAKDIKDPAITDPSSLAFLNKLSPDNLQDKEKFLKLINNNSIKQDSTFPDLVATKHKKVSKGYSTINERREIKYLILRGVITDAIRKISQYFPSVLDSNNLLHFRLLRLNLIEMIRTHKLNNPDGNTEIERQFLNDILKFVRQNLINKVTKSFKLLKELEITMSLLCFNFDPNVKSIEDQKDLPEELRSLFDLSLRTQCYRLVNRAILNLNKENSYQDDELANIDEDQRHYDQLKAYNDKNDYDFTAIDIKELENIDDDADFGSDLESDSEFSHGNKSSPGLKTGNGSLAPLKRNNSLEELFQDELTEDEANKLLELAFESKLEKVVKLWAVTEQRLYDLNIIPEKRFRLNEEFL